MTVYKYFIKIALRNKGIILGYTIMLLVFALIYGGTGSEKIVNFEETRLNIGVINHSNGELSNTLVEYLGKNNNIVGTKEDEDFIKNQIFLQAANAVIIIPEDFEEKVINKEQSIEIFRDDRKVETYQTQNQINKFISFANATYGKGDFDLSNVINALDNSVDVNFVKTSNGANQDINRWFKFYYNFVSYVILAIYIAVIGFVMNDFTHMEIENRRKVSSKKFLNYNQEIYLGQMSIAIFITSILILGSVIIRGSQLSEVHFSKYVLNTLVFSFSALCLVFLINNITNNKFFITGMSTILSLGTSFISGVMVPQEFLGERVLKIAKFFPTYYFVAINNKDIVSLLDVRYEIFMQLLFGLGFLLIGLYFSKVKQKS
ncbi:MAG: ABC transporter permease [Tissierella sp.]|nr:ABC transporter permease [Tissierella sp.]